jgi:hypothetical protein
MWKFHHSGKRCLGKAYCSMFHSGIAHMNIKNVLMIICFSDAFFPLLKSIKNTKKPQTLTSSAECVSYTCALTELL